MGCLFSIIGTLFESVYEELMCLIIPDWKLSDSVKYALELIITVFAGLLFVAIFWGIIMLLNDEPIIVNIGKYMVGIPVAIIVVQIVLGIIVRIVHAIKKKK